MGRPRPTGSYAHVNQTYISSNRMCNNIVCINQHVLTCYKDIKIMLIKDKPFYLQHVYLKAALNYEK